MNQHANKIQEALTEIRQRGRFERLEPPSILVLTRRLLESEGLKKAFLKVKLYSDWCAHPELDKDGAAKVLLEITEELNRSIRLSGNASIDAIYGAVCGALAVSELQKELINLYSRYNVDTWLLTEKPMFLQFMGAILDTIAELPLRFPADIAIRKKGLIKDYYDAACQQAGKDLNWIVMECSVTNSLTPEQQAFYRVPEGTYLWQIKTGAGVAFAGVLHA